MFSDLEQRNELLLADRHALDAHIEALLDLRASGKFLRPIPDTCVGRRLVRIDTRTLIAMSEHANIAEGEMGEIWRAAIAGARSVELACARHVADGPCWNWVKSSTRMPSSGALAVVRLSRSCAPNRYQKPDGPHGERIV